MERLPNRQCPRCSRMNLNIYFSNDEDEKLGAWCENCNLRAYYNGNVLVCLNWTCKYRKILAEFAGYLGLEWASLYRRSRAHRDEWD